MLSTPGGGFGFPPNSSPFASEHPKPIHAELNGFTPFSRSCRFSALVEGSSASDGAGRSTDPAAAEEANDERKRRRDDDDDDDDDDASVPLWLILNPCKHGMIRSSCPMWRNVHIGYGG